MPRQRKPARAFRAPKPRKWTRAQAVQEMGRPTALSNPFDMVHPETHPLLAGFPAHMHPAMIEEAEAIYYADRYAQREQHARERLKECKPNMWDMIFVEFPHIENELNAEQKALWVQAQAEARVRRAVAEQRTKTAVDFSEEREA